MSTQLVAALFVFLVVLLPSNERFYQPAKDADESIVYYKEGPSATVHVAEYKSPEGSYRTLFVDSKSVAGTYDEIVTDQKMLAHLPLLLHPHPQRALTVGFGTGGTSFSMLQHRVKVDCVEIEPAVAGAYEQFRSENQGLVGPHHNRMDFRLILDDARSWLHVADTRYDVIVTDVTSIQYRGNGNLYTVEYFKLMRDRLRPGGLGCAWVPISGITPKELRILMRTFNRVYPHTSVWYMLNTPTDFVILVGSPGPLSIDLADIAERMAAPLVQCDLARIDLDNPYKLLACLLLAEDGVQAYAGEGPVHTDDRPILDYLVHAATRQNTMSANLSRLMEYRCDPGKYVVRWPAPCEGRDPQTIWQNWYAAAGHLLKGHALIYEKGPGRAEMARQEYEAAAELIPDDQGTKALVAGLRRARD